MMDAFYEQLRFGSSRWATKKDIANAGLFNAKGPLIGFSHGNPIFLAGDAPMITIAGAGSGKMRDVLAYNVCDAEVKSEKLFSPVSTFVNDSRGELTAISIQNQIRFRKRAYCINPYGLHGLPSHRVNPWDILRPESRSFHSDVKILVSELIVKTGSANAEYFEARARQWCEAFVRFYAITHGSITMPDLYDLVNSIEDPRAWARIGEAMLNFDDPEIRRTAAEIENKRSDAPKEYGAIIGEIFKSLDFLSDPIIRDTLSGSDFSLEALCLERCNIYNIIPAEYLDILAPMNRTILCALVLYKYRHPEAPGLLLLIDEAPTLKRCEILLLIYNYGRGMGIRVWSFWQDIGQIKRNYGADALSGFIGSSQMRQFFGVRDLDTARMVSQMLGRQTLEYDLEMEQNAARRNKALILRGLLSGDDPFDAGLNYAYQSRVAVSRAKQARDLLSPDEILNMPEDRQILFISGRGLMPIFANKFPYFSREEMAGNYLPNPYHPPNDAVDVSTFWGMRRKRVITEPVPEQFKDFPQYQSGEWSFVEGYRPI